MTNKVQYIENIALKNTNRKKYKLCVGDIDHIFFKAILKNTLIIIYIQKGNIFFYRQILNIKTDKNSVFLQTNLILFY